MNCQVTLSMIVISTLTMFSDCASSAPTLKEVFKDQFLIGTAFNGSHFAATDARDAELIAANFNTITAENEMKWEILHPEPHEFRFDAADRFVEFGQCHDMFIVGHTLIWHSQTPRWVFQGENGEPPSRELLLKRMREHIYTVVGRYKGKVDGWDVVNEALNEDGSLRRSPWFRYIGEDYIVKAFQYAHEADPNAELYYNDYGIENPAKREGAIRILKNLQAAGVPVTGVGIQEHANLLWPSPELVAETIQDFSKLGLKVMITELDVDVLPGRNRGGNNAVSADIGRNEQYEESLNPYTEGLPENMQKELADRYAELFAVYLKHADAISRVTIWGVRDTDSWLNNFPIRGRTNYPLFFDGEGAPKQAYRAIIEIAKDSIRIGHNNRYDLRIPAKSQ